MMLGAVDTIMLSQYSDESVAAVGVVNQIVMFAFLVFEVINIGTSVLCSQYLGAKMHKNMVQVVGVALLLNLVVGLVISAILHFGATTLLGWMGLRPELLKYGIGYMEIVGAFAFFQAISLTISASLRSANKAIYPMLVTVLVNIMNIIGNYSLIFGKFGMPAMGAEGAAISTSIARGVSMIVLFVILFRKHIPKFPLAYFRPFPWIELKNLLKVGLPSAGENLSYSFSQVVITYLINILGNNALATRTYSVNIVMFVYLFAIAMARRRHQYRTPGRTKENTCSLSVREICHATVHSGITCPFVYLGSRRTLHFQPSDGQSGDNPYGSHYHDHRCSGGNRTCRKHLRHQCTPFGRRRKLSVLCGTYRTMERFGRFQLSFRNPLGMGTSRYVVCLPAG